MREMAKEGRSLTEHLQYAGYLIKIANIGQRFQWRSVLQYDTEYCKAQADAGFDFGADSSYLMQVCFCVTALHQSHTQLLRIVHPQTKYDPSSGRSICGKFNTAHGCTMCNCKFAYVCHSCFKPHSENTYKSQRTLSSMTDAATAAKTMVLSSLILTNARSLLLPASVPNGHPVTTEAVYPLVTQQQICDALANGNYIQCDTPPKIVCALSTIPKPDGNIHLIHDCELISQQGPLQIPYNCRSLGPHPTILVHGCP